VRLEEVLRGPLRLKAEGDGKPLVLFQPPWWPAIDPKTGKIFVAPAATADSEATA
jgi:hypothetical protein